MSVTLSPIDLEFVCAAVEVAAVLNGSVERTKNIVRQIRRQLHAARALEAGTTREKQGQEK